MECWSDGVMEKNRLKNSPYNTPILQYSNTPVMHRSSTTKS
jgi:hypothetical protein